MPTLPDRPDLEQLRRQARELLRAAADGETRALTRIRAVSDRIALSSAQLALAREYGFPSWNALRTEAQRRRDLARSEGRTDPDAFDEDRSFGEADAVHTEDGVLHPTALLVGPDAGVLHAWLVPAERASSPDPEQPVEFRILAALRTVRDPAFEDLTVVDDRGTHYTLRHTYGPMFGDDSDGEPRPEWLGLRLDPVPARGCEWLELRDRTGRAARLLPSPRASARVRTSTPTPVSPAERELTACAEFLIELHLGQHGPDFADYLRKERAAAIARATEIRRSGELADTNRLPDHIIRLCAALAGPVPADDLPPVWWGILDGARRADGRRRCLDLQAALPTVDGTTTRIDAIVTAPDAWYAYLRARPGWWSYSEDNQQKWMTLTVRAKDDRGGGYLTTFFGDTGRGDHSEVRLRFRPRLDPLANAITLTFAGTDKLVTVDVRLNR